jgi:hypothetical protein
MSCSLIRRTRNSPVRRLNDQLRPIPLSQRFDLFEVDNIFDAIDDQHMLNFSILPNRSETFPEVTQVGTVERRQHGYQRDNVIHEKPPFLGEVGPELDEAFALSVAPIFSRMHIFSSAK